MKDESDSNFMRAITNNPIIRPLSPDRKRGRDTTGAEVIQGWALLAVIISVLLLLLEIFNLCVTSPSYKVALSATVILICVATLAWLGQCMYRWRSVFKEDFDF
jgi:hypothetical protein